MVRKKRIKNKRFFYTVFLIILLILAAILVSAIPSQKGHSSNEVEGAWLFDGDNYFLLGKKVVIGNCGSNCNPTESLEVLGSLNISGSGTGAFFTTSPNGIIFPDDSKQTSSADNVGYYFCPPYVMGKNENDGDNENLFHSGCTKKKNFDNSLALVEIKRPFFCWNEINPTDIYPGDCHYFFAELQNADNLCKYFGYSGTNGFTEFSYPGNPARPYSLKVTSYTFSSAGLLKPAFRVNPVDLGSQTKSIDKLICKTT